VKNRNVIIIEDSSSTHNYIDIDVTKQLNLFVYPSKELKVMVNDGEKVKGPEICHKVLF
jgi:hypothetical protein